MGKNYDIVLADTGDHYAQIINEDETFFLSDDDGQTWQSGLIPGVASWKIVTDPSAEICARFDWMF
jgi:photosystem II stability/assembly factor-like uncharacterized protein